MTVPLRLRLAKPHKSARFDWGDGPQRIVFWFEAKGERSTLSMAHQRMTEAVTSATMKVFWRDAMSDLAAFLEDGR